MTSMMSGDLSTTNCSPARAPGAYRCLRAQVAVSHQVTIVNNSSIDYMGKVVSSDTGSLSPARHAAVDCWSPVSATGGCTVGRTSPDHGSHSNPRCTACQATSSLQPVRESRKAN